MVCSVLGTISSFSDLLVYPSICTKFFYAIILFAIFIILTSVLYFKDQEKYVKADMISCLGVSALAVLFIALIGTFIVNSEGIPMIKKDIFMYVIAFSIPFIAIWFFKK